MRLTTFTKTKTNRFFCWLLHIHECGRARQAAISNSCCVGAQQMKNAASGTANEASKQTGWTQDEIRSQATSTWQAVTTSFEGTWAELGQYVDAAANQVRIWLPIGSTSTIHLMQHEGFDCLQNDMCYTQAVNDDSVCVRLMHVPEPPSKHSPQLSASPSPGTICECPSRSAMQFVNRRIVIFVELQENTLMLMPSRFERHAVFEHL